MAEVDSPLRHDIYFSVLFVVAAFAALPIRFRCVFAGFFHPAYISIYKILCVVLSSVVVVLFLLLSSVVQSVCHCNAATFQDLWCHYSNNVAKFNQNPTTKLKYVGHTFVVCYAFSSFYSYSLCQYECLHSSY